MTDNSSTHTIDFFRFMRLFRITLFSIIRVETDCIYAVVAWEEDCKNGLPDAEDAQEVLWTRVTRTEIDDALTVGEYAYDAGWISSDRLTVDESELQESFGWSSDRVFKAIDKLFRIKVKMIDDGMEGDSFFMHG